VCGGIVSWSLGWGDMVNSSLLLCWVRLSAPVEWRVRDVIKFVMNFKEPTHRSHPISTSGVERAYSMC